MGDSEQRRMGDYELIEHLGSGAQGQVWKARCLVSGKEFVEEGDIVAIKMLGRTSGDPNEDKRFKRQARILEQLDHPSICRYIDYFIDNEGEFNETQCLVTEYLDGQALDDRLRRHPHGLPWDEVRPIFEQSIAGLAYAARHEVFHRDLKPSNIFITRESQAKIIDFGIARQAGGEETSSGDFRGSFDYMAPDFVLIEGFKGDERSDIFSLGVCFYKALTGDLPFEPLGEGAHIGYLNRWKQADEARPSYRHNAFRVLTKLKGFVQAALSVDLEERFQSFNEMLEALGQIKYRVVRHKGVADYELIDVLGRGGFGEVFKGRVVETGKLVAVKHLFAGRQESRFLKEAKLLQRYKHPDIVSYVDFIEIEGLGDDKEYFLVMEYLPGMPGAALNQRIRKARYGMEPAEVIEVFIHFLSALQFLHESPRPIIHRDIKPGNLYAPPGQPQKSKLFDLGVARDVSGTMTTGMIPGTLDYMAPEFAKPGSDRGTPQSDIYAMGVSMYEALTGRKPYPKLPKSDQEAFVQFVARAQNPPEVSYRFPLFREIPQLERICRRAMAPNPADRYRSAGQMLTDLTALMEQVAREKIDPEDAPTRATIADPALIERLRAHAAGRPAMIPEADMKELLEEPSSRRSVERRPSWMDEEGSYEERDTYAPGAPSPSPAASPYPKSAVPAAAASPPKSSVVKWVAAAAVVVALAAGGYFLVVEGDGRDSYAARVRELAEPDASEAYVRRLLSLVAAGREKKLDDEETYEVWWDNQIAQLLELGEGIPETFARAFSQAVETADLGRAEALLSDWKNLGDAVPFMGMTQREYLVQADDMEGQIGRFYFTAAVNEITRALPEAVDAATLDQGESAATKFRALRAKRWDEVPQALREEEYETIGSALTSRTETFLRDQKQRVLDQYARGEDAGAGADLVVGLTNRAPSLVALAEPLYQAVLQEVVTARDQFEQEREARSTMARLEEAAPVTVETVEQLAQAERAFEETTRQLAARWEGFPEEEKQARLGAIRTNLVNLAESYVRSLSTAAETWYANDEPEASRDADALQGLMDQAPSLMRTLGTVYAQAVSRADQARRDRDDRFRQRKLEEEQRKIELAALEAEQARQRAIAANRETFANAVAELSAKLPRADGRLTDLAQAEEAAQAIRLFAEQRWADVSEAEKDEAVRELTQTLRDRAADHVDQLRAKAVERFGENLTEDQVPEWHELSGLGQDYPTLIALIDSAYDQAVQEAEAALLRAQGVNAFTMALADLRRRIPSQIASPADLGLAEDAARGFQRFKASEWDMVSAEERDGSINRIESTLSRRVLGYVTDLQERALAKYGALEDGGAERDRLASLKGSAPTLVGMIEADYAAALAAVEQASIEHRQLMAFRKALNQLDEAIPTAAETAADIAGLEQALGLYRDIEAAEWPGVAPAERDRQLSARLAAIEGLGRSYVLRLQQRALEAYRGGQDGGPFSLELRSMASSAPALVKLIESDFAQVLTALREAGQAFETIAEFQSTRDRILADIPADIRGGDDLARMEQAAKAYAQVRDRDWEGVPPGEKLAAFEEMRRRMKDVATTYVNELCDQAIERYGALQDADLVRDNLIAMRTIAPAVVAMLEPAYPAALQSVDAARADKERKVREIAAERDRLQRERMQAERLAQARGEEEQRLQQVETAWNRVREQWQTGDDRNLAALYDQILSPQFSLDEFKESHQQIKVSFLNGMKDRLAEVVAEANQAIASFCSHLYQVDDPAFRSFSDSYRATIERPPPVSFALPNLQEIEDVDMGYSRAELLRLQAWKKAGPTLDREATRAELAEQLRVLAAASRKQGQLELASRADMEAALLVSEPAVFPPYLEEVGDPPEVFRWRAHASYQPEGSALDVLRDMERYASRGGRINDYDLRLVMFASYYSWRNAIEGESEYAGRVRRSLDAVLTQADEATAQRALDFIVQYIEEGSDDLEEFPGLYMMNALTMMNSDSALARQAADWLKTKKDQYAVRFAAISPQLELLQRLLGS